MVAMKEYISIGKIVNTHGLKGELKVLYLTDYPEYFAELEWVYIDKNHSLEKHIINSVRYLSNMVLLKFDGINDMTTAEEYKNTYIKIEKKLALAMLSKDTYLPCDIINCEVVQENGTSIGTLIDIIRTGNNDVYVVQDHDNKELLIPALKSIVKEISIENKKIIVSLPEETKE